MLDSRNPNILIDQRCRKAGVTDIFRSSLNLGNRFQINTTEYDTGINRCGS